MTRLAVAGKCVGLGSEALSDMALTSRRLLSQTRKGEIAESGGQRLQCVRVVRM